MSSTSPQLNIKVSGITDQEVSLTIQAGSGAAVQITLPLQSGASVPAQSAVSGFSTNPSGTFSGGSATGFAPAGTVHPSSGTAADNPSKLR